ncbi:MAG: hypothetical protein BJ554DRAFT_2524 [Olpidium bornovanus]|uniref:Uncharacterized protein n=1 Tax=Olpidium bornovanus TaxID=278681 RepID=A0A8H7ZQS5_9FUNG|nr:MAG: hypothetical protein BJ554DRAFT_2524 [Olpidium bornovanus]
MLQLLRACIRDIRQAAQRRPFANADEDGPCGSGKPRSQSASAARRDDRRDADLVFATNLAHDRRILEIVEGLIRRAAAPEKQAAEGRPPGEPDENVLDLADAATGEKPKKSVQISELPRNDIVDAAGPGAKTRRARACEERPKSAPSSRFLHPPSAPPDEPAAEAATAAGGRPKSRGDLPRSGAGKAAAPQTPGGTRSPGRGPPAAPPGTRDERRGRAEHAKFVVKGRSKLCLSYFFFLFSRKPPALSRATPLPPRSAEAALRICFVSYFVICFPGLSVSSCAANLKPPP